MWNRMMNDIQNEESYLLIFSYIERLLNTNISNLYKEKYVQTILYKFSKITDVD